MAVLPLSTRSPALSFNSSDLRLTKSEPSSAFERINPRVSSPACGANTIPTATPIPRPSMKYERPLLSSILMSLLCFNFRLHCFRIPADPIPKKRNRLHLRTHARIWPMNQRPPRLLDAEGLWGFALKLLGMRALTVSELREKFRKRAQDPADIDGVMA